MLRNSLLFIAFIFLFATNVTAKNNYGIVLYNDHGKKFKVYTNGELQNKDFMTEVAICCFPVESVKVKIEFENSKTVEGTIFIRINHMEYDYVSESGIEFDHYERISGANKNNRTPKVISEKSVAGTSTVKREPCAKPKSHAAFYDFYNSLLKHDDFDDVKLTEAKIAIFTECFTAKQVNITMSTFQNESTKLAFAKYAYEFVFDKSNYAIVRERLTEPANLVSFDKFMESKK